MLMWQQTKDWMNATRSTAVIAGTANGAVAASDALQACDAVAVARVDLIEAVSAIGDHDALSMLLIEVEGVDAETLADHLPVIDAAAAAIAVPVVISFDEASIDVVAASMIESGVEFLCAPTATDRIVALSLAAGRGSLLLAADSVREGEAARLQRLNEEVARIADVLAKLTKREPERSMPFVAEHPSPFRQDDHAKDIVIEAGEVRRAIRARRVRDQLFGSGLFEDPAWEILLDLFAAELERAQVSVSSLCIAASVAPTTALRWIAKLTEAGLLERRADPFDRRRAFMALSPRASRTMRDLVGSLRRAGLPFG